jgi:hypothetical protein
LQLTGCVAGELFVHLYSGVEISAVVCVVMGRDFLMIPDSRSLEHSTELNQFLTSEIFTHFKTVSSIDIAIDFVEDITKSTQSIATVQKVRCHSIAKVSLETLSQNTTATPSKASSTPPTSQGVGSSPDAVSPPHKKTKFQEEDVDD